MKKKPFFSVFLEKQISEEQCLEISGGQGASNGPNPIVTHIKLDSPTDPKKDMAHTMKYPSDGDEI